jgi:hypothetical protein
MIPLIRICFLEQREKTSFISGVIEDSLHSPMEDHILKLFPPGLSPGRLAVYIVFGFCIALALSVAHILRIKA